MISYDQYENKIKKYAKFKNFMKRFKFLFIGIFALIIATIATLLAVKGSFSGAIKIANSVYGEAYSDPEGVSAFMSSVSYEYAREGSGEWSKEKPVKAGKYSVRAVANKTIGKGYGKVTSFEIEPREVEFSILSDSVVYGGVPDDISLNLLSGDTYDRKALHFKYDEYDKEITNVDLDERSLKITNGTDDRSSCYTVLHEKKELEIKPCPIYISLDEATNLVYKGSAYSYPAIASDETQSTLTKNGDIIEFKEDDIAVKQGDKKVEALLAGEYSALVGDFTIYRVVDGKKIDVTRQYSAEPKSVDFTIKPRTVKVQTASEEKVYDGTELTRIDGFTVLSGLLDGDELIAKKSTSITNVDKVNNELTEYEIWKGDVELTNNYTVICEGGTLTVTPREIIVTSPSTDTPWIYDGEEHRLTEISCNDTVFTVTANSSKPIIEAGECKNEIYFTISKDGVSVSESNFIIKKEWGTLTVSPLRITLLTRSAQFVYDGELHSAADNCTVFVDGKEATLIAGNALIVESRAELRNVSKTENICKYSVNTKNYIIDDVAHGTIEVVPRNLIVKTVSNTFVYDGEAHSDAGYETSHIGENGVIDPNGLIGNDKLILKTSVSVINVSEVENRCEYGVPNKNYIIVEDRYEYGKITVTPRPITIVTEKAEKVYDGKPLSNDKYKTYYGSKEVSGLLGNDKLILKELYEITNVDESGENKCEFAVPNDNYEIFKYEYGLLKITPRPITIVTEKAEKVYDGKPLSNDKYKTYYGSKEVSGLLGSDKLILQKLCEVTNVKDSGENKCEFAVPNNNYEIFKYEYGTLKITPKTVVVKALDATSTYGEDYKEAKYPTKAGNYTCDDGFIGEGETVKLTVEFDLLKYKSEIKDMSRVPVKWVDGKIVGYEDAVKVVNAEFIGGDVRNYDIKTENGTLYITRRIITVGMQSVTTFYGEELYKGEENEEGRRASAVYPEGRGNVSRVDLHEEYSDFDDEEDSGSNDGNSKVNRGLLEGDEIEVKLISYLNKPSNSTSDEDDQDWETTYIEPKDAKEYNIKPYEIWIYPKDGKTEITTDKDNGDCEGNYLIRYYYPGTLTIKPRPIEVTLNEIVAEEKYYNGEVRIYTAGGEDKKLVTDKVGINEILNDRSTALAYGEKLDVKVIFENIPEFLPKYAGKYFYALDRDNSVIINKDGSISDLSNYSITCENGTLIIEKRALTIQLHDLNLIYGESVEYPDNKFYDIKSELNLVEGDYIRSMYIDFGHGYSEKVNVGKYSISIMDLTIWNNGMAELDAWDILDGYDPVTQSYAIICKEGTLTVDKKPVSVTVYPTSLTYGDEIILTKPAISLSELPYDEEMTFDFAYLQGGKIITPRDAGKYNVKPIPKIDGEEKGANNYEISYFDEEGNLLENATLSSGLVIEKLAISFTVKNQTSTYGDKLKEVEIILDKPIPYDDDVLTFTVIYQKQDGTQVTPPKYFDENGYVIKIDKLYINNEVVFINDGEEIDCNYDFSCKNDGILTIDKRKITVEIDSLTVTYGEPVKYKDNVSYRFHYKITKGDLVESDTLGVNPDFGWEESGKTRPDAGTYTISRLNHEIVGSLGNGQAGNRVDGYLVADSYDIEWVNGTLTVEKRKMSVTLNSILNAYYNGLAHDYGKGGENVDGILSDETLEVEVIYYSVADGVRVGTVDAIGKAGIYEYELDLVNSSVSGGNEEIGNYEISCVWRTCIISKRSIEVKLLDIGDQTYGTNVTYPSGVKNYQKINAVSPEDGGLVDGEDLEIFVEFHAVDWSVASVNGVRLPAGDYVAQGIGASVEGGGDFAHINNYDIKFVDSRQFKVNQKKITVTLNDITVDYGEAVVYEKKAKNYKEEVEGLADDETLTVTEVKFHNKPDYAPVGEYAIKLVKVEIVRNDSNQDVTDSYEVEGVDGLLTIIKRQIRVETATHGFVYDGDPHDTRELDDSYTIKYVKDVKDAEKKGIVDGYGDKSTYENENDLPFVTECNDGVKTNEFYIVIMRNGEDVSKNYDISYSFGELSVVKRQLYVTTKGDTKVYDGLPFTVPDTIEECYSYLNNDPSLGENGKREGLVKGHVFTFDSEAVTITEVGTKDNNTIKDIVESKTSNKSKKSNYEIVTTTLGKLTVTKRVIYVDWSYEGEATYEFVYDGQKHTSPDGGVYTVSYFNGQTGSWETGEENVLVSGHIFKTKEVEIKNAGTIENNPYEGVEVAGSEEDKSRNYDIIFNSGWLKVTPRPVSIETDDYRMTYCNQGPQIAIGYRVQYEGEEAFRGILNDEAQLEIRVVYEKDGERITRFNAGDYEVKLEFVSKNEKFINENYQYEYVVQGILTIDPLQLILQPEIKSVLYGDADYIETTAEKVKKSRMIGENEWAQGLVKGDKLTTLTLNNTVLYASSNKARLSIRIVKNSVEIQDEESQEVITGNYAISLNTGSLEFKTRTICYQQILPEDMEIDSETGYGVVSYTGAKQTINPYNGQPLFRILTFEEAGFADYAGDAEAYGLADGDEAVVKNAYVGKQPGTYTTWVLKLDVKHGDGLRTKLYNIQLSKLDDSVIKVKKAGVSVNLRSAFADAIQDGTFSEGITVLDPATAEGYVEVNSEEDFLKSLGYDWEISVCKEKDTSTDEYTYTVYICIYKSRASGNRIDGASIFEISSVQSESEIEGVSVVQVGTNGDPVAE